MVDMWELSMLGDHSGTKVYYCIPPILYFGQCSGEGTFSRHGHGFIQLRGTDYQLNIGGALRMATF